MNKSPWWQNFFSGLVLESLRRLSSKTQTQAEAKFILELCKVPPGGKILDVPSGEGRLTLALAAQGFEVTGLDISEEFIKEAETRANTQNLNASFHHGDMRSIPWEAEFDAAFCFGNSFAYFEDQENREFCHSIRKTLKPNGKFLLETRLAAESILAHSMERRWFPFGDLYFLHDPDYDPQTGLLTSSYTLIQGGKVESKKAVYCIYTLREIKAMLLTAGFSSIETYGSVRKEPFRLGSQVLYVLANS